MSWLTSLTDAIGLTDSKASTRATKALGRDMGKADAQLDWNMQPVMGMYQNAMQGRDMNSVLGNYDAQMMGTENAAGADNVQNFLNPNYGRTMANASNAAMAGAGSSLQSSANANAVANAVGNQSTQMWNQAFQQAMQDANNKQGIYNQTMNSNLMPSLSWGQLQSDLAGTKYNAATGMAQSNAAAEGQNRGILGSLF